MALNLRKHCLIQCKEQEQLEQLGNCFKVRGVVGWNFKHAQMARSEKWPSFTSILNRASKIY